MIASGTVDLIINTPTKGRKHDTDGFRIRRSAVEHSVGCITAIDTARAILTVRQQSRSEDLTPSTSRRSDHHLPGPVWARGDAPDGPPRLLWNFLFLDRLIRQNTKTEVPAMKFFSVCAPVSFRNRLAPAGQSSDLEAFFRASPLFGPARVSLLLPTTVKRPSRN